MLAEDSLWKPSDSDLSRNTSQRLEEAWNNELTRRQWLVN
jgi:hypothetical protein